MDTAALLGIIGGAAVVLVLIACFGPRLLTGNTARELEKELERQKLSSSKRESSGSEPLPVEAGIPCAHGDPVKFPLLT